MRSATLLAAALLVAACARPSAAPPAAAPSSASLVPVHADTAALRAEAQAIVHAFAAEVARARGAPLGDAPTAGVRNTPQLIFFSPAANQVVVPFPLHARRAARAGAARLRADGHGCRALSRSRGRSGIVTA